MSLQVVTIENASGSVILNIFQNEKLAKLAIAEYINSVDLTFKKKIVKKDSTEAKRLLFAQDTKEEDKTRIFITSVPFEMPLGKGKKAKKDPNAPKKGLSAFMIFSNEQRASVRAKNPTATFGETGSLIGQAWKKLTDKQRTVYTTKSEADKLRYQSELASFSASTSSQAPQATA